MFRKINSLFLVIVITFSVFAISFNFNKSSAYEHGTDIPLIYISGQGGDISINENGAVRNIYPISIPDGYIQDAVKENIGVFVKAVITQEWDEFGTVMHDIMYPLFHELALDENGKPINGSYCFNRKLNFSIDGSKLVGNQYYVQQFQFCYDWRLDPYEIVDELHDYIERVIKITGCDHVAILGRCLGACIASAYMEKYDGEYISDMILYSSALNGSTIVSKMFAGDAYLDADGIERFANDMQLSGDELTNQLLQAFVKSANDTYGLDLLCDAFNNVIEDIYLDIFPKILIDTLGTWPSFWSMVSDEDYERAKATVFHDANMEKYAPFIKIIDNYHYNVQVKASENFKKYIKNGIEISNITKYGYQTIPVTHDADMISDGICSVTDASMGATTATVNTTFSEEYLANAKENGSINYISPDKRIDASTCLLPNRTWFIGNLYHKDFPEVVNLLINRLVNTDGFTTENEEFKQYLIYINDTLPPMTEENLNVMQDKYNISFFERLKEFFSMLFKMIFNTTTNN